MGNGEYPEGAPDPTGTNPAVDAGGAAGSEIRFNGYQRLSALPRRFEPRPSVARRAPATSSQNNSKSTKLNPSTNLTHLDQDRPPIVVQGPLAPGARRRIALDRKAAGQRLDGMLSKLLAPKSQAACQKLVRKGFVSLDGRRVLRSNVRLAGSEVLEVELEPAQPLELLVRAMDDELILVDKPAGMLTHANEKQADGAVADLLDARFGPLPTTAGKQRPGIVHRLDRETSGALVVARTDRAMRSLQHQFREREVSKLYLALVHGRPDDDQFEVDLPLAPDARTPDFQRVDPAGKPARTSFEVLERFDGVALIACRPETGRRHQIRVHLASKRLSIVGDRLYRPEGWTRPSEHLERQALHASLLEFRHPVSDERVSYETPLATDFAELLERLRS